MRFMFGRKKEQKPKEVKLCHEDEHDWYEVGKCKDALGRHPCKYHPEGCATCLTRFECYTKDSDTYRDRISGVFYACRKCPAVKIVGSMSEWKTRRYYDILDCRDKYFICMDKALVDKLAKRWTEKAEATDTEMSA